MSLTQYTSHSHYHNNPSSTEKNKTAKGTFGYTQLHCSTRLLSGVILSQLQASSTSIFENWVFTDLGDT